MVESDFFVAGGTLRVDSPSYVTRSADEQLLSDLMYGEFCYVLTSRQMGKSSLMVRTAQQLKNRGIRAVRIDLTSIGTVSSDQWYLGLLSRIRSELRLSVDTVEWWQAQPLSAAQNFTAFLRDVVLTECSEQIVIFIDEIDSTLNLEFRDDFFAAIRAIYNGRANEPLYDRLTFALLGVATPTELIQDHKRTPFNIGRRIDLQEFGYQDARPLLDHLTEIFPDRAAAILHRIFHWTDGHPYLTQKLCSEIAARTTDFWDDHAVDRLVERSFLSDDGRKDTNLVYIQDRILSGSMRERRSMLSLYEQVYDGKSIANDDRSVAQNRLKLYGLIKVRENRLDVRNEIYRSVFNTEWINALSQNSSQPPLARFIDWFNARTVMQRWLATASIFIALLVIVGAVVSNRPAVVEQIVGANVSNRPIDADQSILSGVSTEQAVEESVDEHEQPVVTPVDEIEQPLQTNANQEVSVDYDQALQEVIRPAPGYAGYAAYPKRSMRTDITEPLASLGQSLFFDPILSGDGHISCATCHHPRHAMADGRILPIGTGGFGIGPQRTFTPTLAINEVLALGLSATLEVSNDGTIPNPFSGLFVPRNTPSMINAALYPVHMWDGRIEGAYETEVVQQSDEELIHNMPLIEPLVNRTEMAGITLGDQEPMAIVETILERLRSNPTYVEQFQRAFEIDNLPADELVTLQRLGEALFAFEKALIFVEAQWDRYIDGQKDALTEEQKRGALLFFGKTKPAVNCTECHRGNLFSDFKAHNLLVPQIGPGKGHGATAKDDWGRAGVTDDEAERCAFRTPSLRNVALTAPYFHDGAFATLETAIRHHQDAEQSAAYYDVNANNIPPELQMVQPQESCLEAWRKNEIASIEQLTDNEIASLVEFLKSLTDPAAEQLEHLIPTSVPSGLPLEPRPWESQLVLASTSPSILQSASRNEAGTDDPVVQENSKLNPLVQLLAPEDKQGKGDLLGADQQNKIAVRHLGLLREALAEIDLAEGKRHAEHVINILVGTEDKKFGDHNVDDRTEVPGDGFGIKRYLEQAKEETQKVLDDLDSTPSTADIRLQVEQILEHIEATQIAVADTVDQAFQIFPTVAVAEAQPIAQELTTQMDSLTEAISQTSDAVTQLPQTSGPNETDIGDPVVQANSKLGPLVQLLAPEDEQGKGDLFGVDQQYNEAVRHLDLLRESLAEIDLAEGKRHAEHVINILVGRGDDKFGDHNLDDRPEVPGDGFGIKRYLVQAKEETQKVLDDLGTSPSTADIRNQVEQILEHIEATQMAVSDSVDQAFKIFPAASVAEARPIAQELNDQMDTLTEAIHATSDVVRQLLQSVVPVENLLGRAAP